MIRHEESPVHLREQHSYARNIDTVGPGQLHKLRSLEPRSISVLSAKAFELWLGHNESVK